VLLLTITSFVALCQVIAPLLLQREEARAYLPTKICNMLYKLQSRHASSLNQHYETSIADGQVPGSSANGRMKRMDPNAMTFFPAYLTQAQRIKHHSLFI